MLREKERERQRKRERLERRTGARRKVLQLELAIGESK